MTNRFGFAWLGAVLLGAASIGCSAGAAPLAASTVKAGSMARFIAHHGLLYALDESELLVYDASERGSPRRLHAMGVPADAETLYPYDELLFVGTRQGMLVYSLAKDPRAPELIGRADHAYSCDPVVVQNDIAYVTLRDGSSCRAGVNALLVFDVKDPTQPREMGRRDMTSPHGLGVDGHLLFVADAKDGLLIFDVREPAAPRLMAQAPDIGGYDVIAHAGRLYVVADDGLYQYVYGPEGIRQTSPLSRIPIGDGTVAQPKPVEVTTDPAPTGDAPEPLDPDNADPEP